MHFDFRIVVVLLPILVAGGWALFNIGAAALRQLNAMLNAK